MQPAAGVLIFRLILAAVGVACLVWAGSMLGVSERLAEAARGHAASHAGAANKLTAGGDLLSTVSTVFGLMAGIVGVGMTVAALWPWRRTATSKTEPQARRPAAP